MREQLIAYATAVLAKEKGFDKITFNKRASNGELYEVDDFPTQSLLQKWLRDVHSINIQIIWVDTLSDIYVYHISTTNNASRPNSKFYHSYEKALEACLIKSLKLLP